MNRFFKTHSHVPKWCAGPTFLFLKGRAKICTNYSNSSLIITLAALVVILFLGCILFLPLFNTHQWQCLFCRCAARHERACRSRSVLRTSAASLSALSGTEPHYLGNTKHMALRQTGPWQSACATKLPKLQWTCEKQTFLTVYLLFFYLFLLVFTAVQSPSHYGF